MTTYTTCDVMRDESKMKQWVSLEDAQAAIESAYKDAAGIAADQYSDIQYSAGFRQSSRVISAKIFSRLEQIKKGVGG